MEGFLSNLTKVIETQLLFVLYPHIFLEPKIFNGLLVFADHFLPWQSIWLNILLFLFKYAHYKEYQFVTKCNLAHSDIT